MKLVKYAAIFLLGAGVSLALSWVFFLSQAEETIIFLKMKSDTNFVSYHSKLLALDSQSLECTLAKSTKSTAAYISAQLEEGMELPWLLHDDNGLFSVDIIRKDLQSFYQSRALNLAEKCTGFVDVYDSELQ